MNTIQSVLPWAASLSVIILTGCASNVPRIQHDIAPPGSLRLGQVFHVFSKAELQQPPPANYDLIRQAGVPDSEIKDGSTVLLRVYCCGGGLEETFATLIYLPTGITAEKDDVVEYRAADKRKKGTLAQIHVATRVRQKGGDTTGTIRWDPPNERLWMRVLYGEWMKAEGWKYQSGVNKGWYKPPPN